MEGGFFLENSDVSVIIPVHNGEKYLERCIESILNQSYKNIELLIIDDNSTDASYDVIAKYMKFSNVRFIKNSETLGPAKTRNIGLQNVASPYILFLDCDDWIDLNCIEKAMRILNTNSSVDIAIWEIKTAYYSNHFSIRYQYQYNNILDNKMALGLLSHSYENEYFISPLLGCKLFRKQILDKYKLSFPNTIYEDDMFTFLAILYSKNIALITGSNLYYYQHFDSITHNFSERNIIDFFSTFNELYKYIDTSSKKYYYKYLSKSLSSMLTCMTNNITDTDMLAKYKSMIFTSFYKNINVLEYYSYSFTITI